jgi:hypothetical protein
LTSWVKALTSARLFGMKCVRIKVANDAVPAIN